MTDGSRADTSDRSDPLAASDDARDAAGPAPADVIEHAPADAAPELFE